MHISAKPPLRLDIPLLREIRYLVDDEVDRPGV